MGHYHKDATYLYRNESKTFIELPYIAFKYLSRIQDDLYGIPGSRKHHNTHKNGLFNHSLAVVGGILHTRGFDTLTCLQQEILILMAFLHDMKDKAKWTHNLHVADSRLRYLMRELFGNTFVIDIVMNFVYKHHHLMIDGYHDYYSLHRYFVSNTELHYMNEQMIEATSFFLTALSDVSRSDAYDAGYSKGLGGASDTYNFMKGDMIDEFISHRGGSFKIQHTNAPEDSEAETYITDERIINL